MQAKPETAVCPWPQVHSTAHTNSAVLLHNSRIPLVTAEGIQSWGLGWKQGQARKMWCNSKPGCFGGLPASFWENRPHAGERLCIPSPQLPSEKVCCCPKEALGEEKENLFPLCPGKQPNPGRLDNPAITSAQFPDQMETLCKCWAGPRKGSVHVLQVGRNTDYPGLVSMCCSSFRRGIHHPSATSAPESSVTGLMVGPIAMRQTGGGTGHSNPSLVPFYPLFTKQKKPSRSFQKGRQAPVLRKAGDSSHLSLEGLAGSP